MEWQTEEDALLALSVPLGSIAKVDIGKQKERAIVRKYYVEVLCKDFRSIRLLFSKSDKHHRDSIYNSLNESGCLLQCAFLHHDMISLSSYCYIAWIRLLFPNTPERLFAFFYKPSHLIYDRDCTDSPSGESASNLKVSSGSDIDTSSLTESNEPFEDDNGSEWKRQGWDVFYVRSEFERYMGAAILCSPPPRNCSLTGLFS